MEQNFRSLLIIAVLLTVASAVGIAANPLSTVQESSSAEKPRLDGEHAPEWWKSTGNPRGQWWLTAPRYEGAAAEEIWKRVPIPPSPVLSPEESLDSFVIDERFKIELVAAEPLIVRPVFFRFDEGGRLWVVEMPGFMRDIEGSGENDPSGRVVVLEDTDGDGRMDKATTFMDGLVMPRTLAFVAGGVLVVEPPKIWYARDTDGDLVADEKILLADDYGEYGNPEHSANGLLPAIDNWMYSAKSAVRYRFKEGRLHGEPTMFRGQWGITQDDVGRLYYNYNASPLHTELVGGEYLVPDRGVDFSRPNQNRGPMLANVSIVEDKSVYPVRVTPLVTLGASDLRPDGTLKVFTAACSPHIYRGHLFPPSYRGNAFVCDPVGNFVTRFLLETNGPERRAERTDGNSEFLASTDERFRPVFLETGPDGALYIADMYTGIVEHKRYVTEYLRNQVLNRDVGEFASAGRIYRVVPANASAPAPTSLAGVAPARLVESLSSDNGWVRDTAQRLLVQDGRDHVVPELKRVVSEGPNPLGRLHALWTLDGLGRIELDTVLRVLRDPDPRLRHAGLRMTGHLLDGDARGLREAYARLTSDPDPEVRLQLVSSLGRSRTEWARHLIGRMLVEHDDGWLIGAAGAALQHDVVAFVGSVLILPAWEASSVSRTSLLEQLGLIVMQRRDPATVAEFFDVLERRPHTDWRVNALLRGVGILPAPGRPLPLARKPELLTVLGASKESSVRELAGAIGARITWPGNTSRQGQVEVAPLTPREQALLELGREQYAMICAACHQPNGQGMVGVAPSLVGTRWVMGPARVPINIVMHGLSGPIEVNGEKWNMLMPGLGAAGGVLDDEKIAGVVTYIRRQWGNQAGPVTAEQVAEERKASTGRHQPWKADELEPLFASPAGQR